jgi:ATP-binding cassette, subfamily B, bacterial
MKDSHKSARKITFPQVVALYWKEVKTLNHVFVIMVIAYIIASATNIINPLFYKKFFDVMAVATDRSASYTELLHIILIVLGLNLGNWASFRCGQFLLMYYSAEGEARLRNQAFNYTMGHSYSFFANNFGGALVQRISRYVRAFERLTDRLVFDVIPLIVRAVGVAISVAFIDIRLTWAFIVWMIIFLAFNYSLNRWKLKYEIKRAAADSRTTAVLSDAITNHNTVMLFNGKKPEAKFFAQVTDEQAKITLFTWNMSEWIIAGQSLLILLMEFFIFYYTLHFWEKGLVQIGVFVLLQSYILIIGRQLWDFGRVVRDFYEASADAKEMAEILYLPHEISDVPHAQKLSIAGGEISFKHLEFSFGAKKVLHDINLNIKAGEKVALVGPSGAGKTTIIRLLLRYYQFEKGNIGIDGQDIRSLRLESIYDHMSLVPQDPLLFHRTLMENIRYGRPDATDEEVKDAARKAHCDEFISALPSGFDTYVGERGIKLSGGERQRVAIARAILKNAPILILDEATSSLDSHSEALIQDAMDSLMKGKTVIVIAHRLSTIKKMDRIVVLEHGSIIEEGTHESLTHSSGLYSKLWSLQAGGFITE